VRIARDKYLPSHNRGIPVPKEPATIGGHLRRRRQQLKIRQSEAAGKLGVSTVTLSRWERDAVYPAWAQQRRVIEYLGYDPFVHPELGRPKGNETQGVAILSPQAPVSFSTALRKHRLELRKSQKEFAKILGVDAKTLRHWEMGRHSPSPLMKEQVLRVFANR
jgi:transcriptional regulator with XRE-family HTH domain